MLLRGSLLFVLAALALPSFAMPPSSMVPSNPSTSSGKGSVVRPSVPPGGLATPPTAPSFPPGGGRKPNLPSGGAPPPRNATVVIPSPGAKAPETKMVNGKVKLMAVIPRVQNVDVVVFYISDKPVGKTPKSPYIIEWDCSAMGQGAYTAKYVALDSGGKELASNTAPIFVSRQAVQGGNGPTGPMPPVTPVVTPRVTPTAPPEPTYTTYASAKYHVHISHQDNWTVKDKSSSLGKGWPGGYWLVFSTDPVSSALYTVNLRHKLLQKEPTEESFVKYNPYVAEWEQTEINGNMAFLATQGSATAKRVVHRAIILEGRHQWMVNMIDVSGGPAEESSSVFQRMINSLGVDDGKNPTPPAKPGTPGAKPAVPPTPPVNPGPSLEPPKPETAPPGSTGEAGDTTDGGEDAPPDNPPASPDDATDGGSVPDGSPS